MTKEIKRDLHLKIYPSVLENFKAIARSKGLSLSKLLELFILTELAQMELRVCKLSATAGIPEYQHETDAGLDLVSVEDVEILPGECKLIKTGIAIALPINTEAQIRPRSGLALKHGITVLNTPGTIDQGYRGEICVILINHGNETFQVNSGMKIAQMVICPIIKVTIQEVNKLEKTSRGSDGFGSTGM